MLRKFRNRSEFQMQQQFRPAAERHGAELQEKVRVADLIDIEPLHPRSLGDYALRAHFDFVLIDEKQEAVVAIEFDGPGHDSRNDKKKDSICQHADLPLVRVYGFERVRQINEITLARFIVELVFHAGVFLQMQEDGHIAADEPFMLDGFLKPHAKNIFDSEFDFIANRNGKLTRALKKSGLAAGPLPHLSINHVTVRAPDGRLRAFMGVDTSKGPIVGTSSLRVAFPSLGFLAGIGTLNLQIADFVSGMAADDLLENILLVGDGFGHVVTDFDEVVAELKTLGNQGYTLVQGGGAAGTDANLMSAFAAGNGGKLF